MQTEKLRSVLVGVFKKTFSISIAESTYFRTNNSHLQAFSNSLILITAPSSTKNGLQDIIMFSFSITPPQIQIYLESTHISSYPSIGWKIHFSSHCPFLRIVKYAIVIWKLYCTNQSTFSTLVLHKNCEPLSTYYWNWKIKKQKDDWLSNDFEIYSPSTFSVSFSPQSLSAKLLLLICL